MDGGRRPTGTDVLSTGNGDYPAITGQGHGDASTARDIVDEFIDNGTTHGVPRILRSDRPVLSRLFWCFFTLTALGVLLWQGSSIVVEFFNRPTTTKISIVTQAELDFPSVTICNLNMMRRSKLKGTRFQGLAELDNLYSDLNGDTDDYSWFFTSEDESSANTTTAASSIPSAPQGRRRRRNVESEPESSYYVPDYNDWDGIVSDDDWPAFYRQSTSADFSDLQDLVRPTMEELRDFGHKAKDFIQQCTFDTNPCSYKNFTECQNMRYGNCFVFNDAHKLSKVKKVKTSRTGAEYGLHLTLFVEQPEYVGVLTPESGAKVAINNPLIYAFPEDDGITASTGQATSIGLRKVKFKITTTLLPS